MVAYTTTYNLKKPTVADDEDVWGGYLNDSMDLIDDVLDGTTPVTGIDINSGTIDNVVVGGTTAVAGTFTVLTANTSLGVTGNITVSGTVDGRDVAADGTKLDGVESGATADQTKADIDALGIAATTASTLATARNIAVTGAVTGNANFDGSGNISISTTATADPTLTLSGDASGSATFTNLGNATLSVTVADDSHNHVISNVDGLQTALDGKLSTSGKAADSNLLDGIDSSEFLRSNAADTTTGELTVGASQDRQLVLDRNIATPSNYYAGLQQEIRATSGAAGIGLHRNGYSHVGIYHDAQDTLKFNMNSATVTMNAAAGTLWGSGNDGSGSGLDADNLDGRTWETSGKNVRGTEVYADGWFRNYNVGYGLYNEATGAHFMSEGSGQWTIMDSDSSMQLRLETNSGTYRGALYANSSNEVGILDSDNAWAIKHVRDWRTEFHINGSNKMQVDNNGLYLYDGSLREDYDALSGTSPTCNVNNGGAFSLSMSGNTTFTFSGATSGMSSGFILQLTGNGSTVTWPTSVDWAGGTAPDAPASGETDIYVFWTRDGGTTWYGVQSIDAAA